MHILYYCSIQLCLSYTDDCTRIEGDQMNLITDSLEQLNGWYIPLLWYRVAIVVFTRPVIIKLRSPNPLELKCI